MLPKNASPIQAGAFVALLGAVGIGTLLALLPLLAIMGLVLYFMAAAIYWAIGGVGVTILGVLFALAFGPVLLDRLKG